MKDLIRVSTKKGDGGKSFLISGRNISKSDLIFEVLGTLDELNSHLGLVVAKINTLVGAQLGSQTGAQGGLSKEFFSEFTSSAKFLLEIQNTLFYLGAQLAKSSKESLKKFQLIKLEKESDKIQLKMADNWISKFVLPGGTELGAHIDIARTVSRRFERLVVALSEEKEVSALVLKYVNRLSDHLFVLRCFVNDRLSAKENLFESKKSSK